MTFSLILFLIFSFLLIISAVAVVFVKNMVYGVLFLISCFINTAGLFIMLGAEFIAMLLIVVYVGAIAVLFLFVVMMLNVDNLSIKKKISKLSTSALTTLSLIILLEIFLIVKISFQGNYIKVASYPIFEDASNVRLIGNILYTKFFIPFQISGAILFVAMIGAIVLTLNEKRVFIKRQNISNQVLRNKENSIEMVKVESNKGIEI